ncbi:MAG: hypothetical protein DRO10_00355 [Thermoprotei archaeon]|nr:MAG: hypothetical protein DRO10_00355 [Thermoprotei archaeon]
MITVTLAAIIIGITIFLGVLLLLVGLVLAYTGRKSSGKVPKEGVALIVIGALIIAIALILYSYYTTSYAVPLPSS